ncbi:hypothetical protein [Glycomyces sp. NPDC021274]|uniref:hypothetical protein n=1 Tax=Glycomyces sp. NPDC021274 TaxID=3155120 RepID=UPI0033C663CF
MTVESFSRPGLAYAAVALDHFACCCDFFTTFCGLSLDRADYEWTDADSDLQVCVVCLDLYEHYQEVSICCPKDPAVRRG